MRERTEILRFRASPEERRQIENRMAELGIQCMAAYLRKMALNGLCIRLDLAEVREVVSLLRRCSNNLNQYAKKANASGSIYLEDIRDVQRRLDEIWGLMRQLLVRLAGIK